MSRVEVRLWPGRQDLAVARRFRRGIHYEAYVPDHLMGRPPVLLPSDVAETIAEATRLIQDVNKTEPVATDLEAARMSGSPAVERDSTAEAVLGNIEAMQFAVGEMCQRPNITSDDILVSVFRRRPRQTDV